MGDLIATTELEVLKLQTTKTQPLATKSTARRFAAQSLE